uniref:Uncharacterized protein n=1 Tax=Triticum urartu TaxID=4572 RepID=A0A8R7V5J7_TRIUA
MTSRLQGYSFTAAPRLPFLTVTPSVHKYKCSWSFYQKLSYSVEIGVYLSHLLIHVPVFVSTSS